MQPQQQRTETSARALGGGVADDDEFLSVAALDLDPAAAALADIAAAAALADQPFELHLAGAFENALRRLGEILGKTQQIAIATRQNFTQRRATLLQRHLAQVQPVQVRRIEQVIEDAATAAGLEGILQRLEIRRAALARHHHLAIEPARLQSEPGKRGSLLRHLRRPVMTIAGEQLHPPRINARKDAVAVELDLVAPVTARHRIHQRGQLRCQRGRQVGGNGAR
ncbi:hypothetical protein SSTU70S_05396 [Stutzerimonas stutzeri]